MRDGFEEAIPEHPRPRLTYPFEAGPKTGEAIEVAPGVKWLRMPLGGSLAYINVWAIAEDGGWAIVDTGMGGPETQQAWRKAFAGALGGLKVTRVFVTHMHPDHIGMAGWITRKFDCRLWISRLEFLMCRSLAADTGREAPEDALTFYRAAGWDDEAIEDRMSSDEHDIATAFLWHEHWAGLDPYCAEIRRNGESEREFDGAIASLVIPFRALVRETTPGSYGP